MAFEKITQQDLAGKGNLGRPDTPGVTTEEMQRILDELPREVIIPKFNALVGALEDTAAAAQIGAMEGEAATTVQAALEDRYRRGETYTRAETDAAIAKKVDKAGFLLENGELNEPFSLDALALEFIESGYYKGG